jgi:cyclase
VKTVRFEDARYIGDPINAVRIFNEKEVDELIFLDIGASARGMGPNLELLANIASEAFMPFAYGGGVRSCEDAQALFAIGIEKVVLNSGALRRPDLIGEIARAAGSQSVVVCVDVRRSWLGRYEVVTSEGRRRKTGLDAVAWARRATELGAGEVVVQSVDRDGTMQGYDLELLGRVAAAVNVPVVALGGASGLSDMRRAVEEAHVSAVAAGSLFVFHGKHRAVLITYPSPAELRATFGK